MQLENVINPLYNEVYFFINILLSSKDSSCITKYMVDWSLDMVYQSFVFIIYQNNKAQLQSEAPYGKEQGLMKAMCFMSQAKQLEGLKSIHRQHRAISNSPSTYSPRSFCFCQYSYLTMPHFLTFAPDLNKIDSSPIFSSVDLLPPQQMR